jgi:hypothetical protein
LVSNILEEREARDEGSPVSETSLFRRCRDLLALREELAGGGATGTAAADPHRPYRS